MTSISSLLNIAKYLQDADKIYVCFLHSKQSLESIILLDTTYDFVQTLHEKILNDKMQFFNNTHNRNVILQGDIPKIITKINVAVPLETNDKVPFPNTTQCRVEIFCQVFLPENSFL